MGCFKVMELRSRRRTAEMGRFPAQAKASGRPRVGHGRGSHGGMNPIAKRPLQAPSDRRGNSRRCANVRRDGWWCSS